METGADVVSRWPADAGRAAADLYDERNRQAKALALWERQKAAWARMQKRLASLTTTSSSRVAMTHPTAAAGSVGASTARTFTGATPAARAKREDFGLLAVAEPEVANEGSHAWEGLLRCTDPRLARRLVPIGRTWFPYYLYSEARNPAALPDDHMIYTRVVSEGDVEAARGATESHPFLDSTVQRVRQRAAAQSRVRAALMSAVAQASEDIADSEDTRISHEGAESSGAVSYYESKLRRFAPYVMERLGHFLQPRVFLHVDGHRAPRASAEEMEAQGQGLATARLPSPPPVEYYPPPSQTQMWASMPTSDSPSGIASTVQPAAGARKRKGSNKVAVGGAHSHSLGALPNVKDHSTRADEEDALSGEGEGDEENLPGGSVSTATPSERLCDISADSIDGDAHAVRTGETRAASTSPLHPLQVDKCGTLLRHQRNRAEAGEEEEERVQTSGPSMELSTRSLFFQTRPHELLQGTVTLCNTGTTTIYFSWVPVDPVEEQFGHLGQDSGAAAAAEEVADDGTVHEDGASGKHRQQLSVQGGAAPAAVIITHSLAVHQRAARDNFFFLSSPMNGVVLPEEQGTFAFAVRATRAGLFQHTYELLTVPPAPNRIFVRLRALIQSDSPALEWLAAPVAEAIEAKVMLDAQRRLAQKISMDVNAIEGSDLSKRIDALDLAANAAAEAERKLRQAQEDAWNLANRLTFDHIPYATAVYDKLEELYAVVQETCRRLGRPKKAETDAALKHSTAASTAPSFEARARPSAACAALPAPFPPPKVETTAPAANITTTALGPAKWDGSLLLLVQQMMAVRDAPTRQTFFEALFALLRAARASRNHRSRGGGNEDVNPKTLPLPTLLAQAASDLADSLQRRRAAMLERECENLLGQKLAVAATPFMRAFAEASGTAAFHGTAGGREAAGALSSGTTANRPRSVSGRKRTTSARGKGGAAATVDRAEGATVTELTKAQRVVLDAIPTEELLSFSAIQATPKTAAALETAEKAAVCMQRETELAAERGAWIELYAALFLEAIDAACNRGPLSMCTAERLAELEDIQTSPLLPIDLSADPIFPLTTGKGGKRK
ncbi:hypothetical protein LSCM1_06068 [Leishmania martiniquensis]|uniref:Uncharacterized protein n=1 Tax=Leishmania martiniquensis TaxID=1580590 RepID=A0A836GRB8_9TRYP|nr:hypothetical protein LSCM1_06068 [Leishmania martiniquensis]